MADRADHLNNHAPPRKAGLAEQVASLIEGVSESDLRSAADSFLPSIVPVVRDPEEDVPTPFELVHRKSIPGFSSIFDRAHYLRASVTVVTLLLVAGAGARLRSSAQPLQATQTEPRIRTPAQAASWAAQPFTVEVPLERSAAAEDPKPTAPSASPAPAPLAHFDIEAAAAALVEAKNSLSDCEADDDAPTNARATVTFAPAGNVSAVTLDRSSNGAPPPACVIDRLRSVRIAPFSGSSVTVHTTVTFPAL